jgi:phospholipid N-methyltransferase
LIKQITKNSKISLFEIDEEFCKLLKEKYKNDKRITIYEKSAYDIKEYFDKESVDYIISSLPLAFISKNHVSEILEKSKYILKKE